ncbi:MULTISPECIES: HAD family hydrolase [Roseobacteraceae]|uniref:HAD family hydrolase n=1 Tax=Roseobacteraceae TaxID=2854170 RepID=UPI0012FD55A7|nr:MULTISPECIES: HAD-IA family hydrolase [Roseobacteraceae]
MRYSALLLGSIGVLVDTFDLQRRAFNAAFAANDLDWAWSTEEYAELSRVIGGHARIQHYADSMDHEVDASAIYDSKIDAFGTALEGGVSLRPGISDLIAEARRCDVKIACVSAEDKRQVALILRALGRDLDPSVFDYIGDGSKAARPKPEPAIYRDALRALNVDAGAALAIEDTPEGAASAVDAGIDTFAYPGPGMEDRTFEGVIGVGTPSLDLLHSAEPTA